MLSRHRTAHRITALAAALCLAGLSQQALAQEQTTAEGFALSRFHPAPAGDRMFGIPSPFTAGDLTPHLMLLADYAEDPLVLRAATGDEARGSVVGNQFLLHLNASLALWSRLTLNVNLPLAFQGGDQGVAGGTTVPGPSGAGIGDLRLGARATLLGGYFDGFQLALGGYLWVPTGSPDAYTGDGGVRGAPQLIVGGLIDRLVWSGVISPELRGSTSFANVEPGTSLQWGVGLGYLVGDDRRIQVGAELLGAAALGDLQTRTTNLEVLFDGRYRVNDSIEAGVGAGPGLSPGVGTPSFRAVAMVAYSPAVKPPVQDRDRDGIEDADDACPDVRGVASADPKLHGCPPPPPDTDKDGIFDAEDACVNEPGVPDPDPAKNGCPPPKDSDNDGIVDPQDACPAVPGVADPDPAKNGCPPDKDGDKVLDKDDACVDIPGEATEDPKTNGCPDADKDGIYVPADACPNEKGKPDPDPTKNGCPVAVRVTESEIVILQQVQFDTAKATIKQVSNALLDEVAEVLKEHPEIVKLEVQGHTDDRGGKALNKKLSQARSDAVMKALTQRGVAAERLTAVGYGQDVPIAENKTADGRQKNRRVQFKILEKAKK
ncbi:MAG TPA: OmpA family protein [Candidatus Nanopelagicales bacterium]|nr:OmpA family protein [Candidatus Nanopelagicales bacterium]